MITDRQVANRFWQAMGEIYGKAWTKQFGDEPTQIWTRKLYEIGVEKIAFGIEELIDNGMKFPPSLPEFIKVCQRKIRPAYHTNVVAITDNLTHEQRENGIKHLSQIMRKTLEKD